MTARRRGPRPWILSSLLAAAVAATVLATSNGSLWPRPEESAAGVRTATVGRGDLSRTVVATGVIRPVVGAEIDVGCRVSGTVLHLPVEVGQFVKAGDLLAQLDTTELDAVVEQARAGLEVARADLALAESAFARRRQLAETGVIAAEELEVARRDLDVRRARGTDAEARLEVAEINRGYARILAPIPGVIAEVSTREGETVAASLAAPTFVTIVDLDRLEVRTFVDETDVGRVFIGQTATFTVDTYPDVEIGATVTSIEPKAELQSSVVNYVVVLDYETRDDVVLRPEMTAHVQLELERRDDVLTVPRAALRRVDGRSVVRVLREGVWVDQEVGIGGRTDLAVEVQAGLAEGETVMINPI